MKSEGEVSKDTPRPSTTGHQTFVVGSFQEMMKKNLQATGIIGGLPVQVNRKFPKISFRGVFSHVNGSGSIFLQVGIEIRSELQKMVPELPVRERGQAPFSNDDFGFHGVAIWKLEPDPFPNE